MTSPTRRPWWPRPVPRQARTLRPAAAPRADQRAVPDDGALVWLKTSHYSPFVAHHRRYTSLPPDLDPEALTLKQDLALVAEAASPSAAEASAAVGRVPVNIVGLRSWNAEAGTAGGRAVVTLDAGLAFAGCCRKRTKNAENGRNIPISVDIRRIRRILSDPWFNPSSSAAFHGAASYARTSD